MQMAEQINPGATDSGLIMRRVKPMTLKMVFVASLLDVQQSDSVENKSASLLLVPLGKALSRIPSVCAR